MQEGVAIAVTAVLGFLATGIVGCLAAMGGQLYERRKWERQLLERAGYLTSAKPASELANLVEGDDRMARLQLAMDTMAIEVERVGEGQRFVTKLLAERPRDPNAQRSPQPGSIQASPRPHA